MNRSSTLLAAAAASLAVVAFAGCGGSAGTGTSSGSGSSGYGSGRYGSGSSQATTTASTSHATIDVAKSSLGRILVDGNGRTLYLFEKDKGTASTCSGGCAGVWPPVTTSGASKAGSGTATAKLGTSKRQDGTLQVTYNGHPLYTYTGDSQSGQTNGEGVDDFGAEWYALSPAGQAVESGGS